MCKCAYQNWIKLLIYLFIDYLRFKITKILPGLKRWMRHYDYDVDTRPSTGAKCNVKACFDLKTLKHDLLIRSCQQQL